MLTKTTPRHSVSKRWYVGSILACLSMMFSHCTRPQIQRSEIEVKWTVRYMGYACGDYEAQLRPIFRSGNPLDLKKLAAGLIIYVPHGIESPDQIRELRVPGNEFVLRGYYYYTSDGAARIIESRFDLLGWRAVSPLRIWAGSLTAELETNDRLPSQDSGKSDVDPQAFEIAGKYSGCSF